MISATNLLVAANVIAYVWLVLTGGPDDNRSLVAHGALVPALVWQGQWWRLISSAFLHAGLVHIGLNMLALFQVGTFLERLIGWQRLLAIYALSLLGGSFAVLYFSGPGDVTIGASGAIFGIFGALAAIGLRLGRDGRSLIVQTLPIIVLNLAFGFAMTNISNAGHIGGLLTGFVATLAIVRIRRRPTAPVVAEPAPAPE